MSKFAIILAVVLFAPFPVANAFALPAKTVLKEKVAKADFFTQALQVAEAESPKLIGSNYFVANYFEFYLTKTASMVCRRDSHSNESLASNRTTKNTKRARDSLRCMYQKIFKRIS